MNDSINILKAAQTSFIPNKEIFPYIIQIGTGGTGGYLTQHISQLLGVSKKRGAYTVVDPDVIETKNLGNQLFLPEEVGLKKAEVLAQRYSYAYGIDIATYTDNYIESVEDIRKLFTSEYLQVHNYRSDILFLPILIGCVDNNFSRSILNTFFETSKTCIYIDAGNESTVVPKDWQVRTKSSWTEEELIAFNESGWSGQVVTGVKLNLFKQPPVAEVFPDILEDKDSFVKPSELSCTELTASEPQRLIVNKFAAMIISNILTQIVEDYTISSHMTVFHAKKAYMRSTPIQNVQKNVYSTNSN
ncbi:MULTISPECIES: ThiF family adenylyltransferase [unclassified Psychrobacillus]|uniref:ThiF family adenylyltransferase n=1 Tax=unclassified Psychrobacillus TaxID=2636677 RepID=UPI0030FA11F9